MSDTFGVHARRLAGLTTRAFGWPPHWFWQSTPEEIAAIFTPEDNPQAGVSRAELDAMMEQDSHG